METIRSIWQVPAGPTDRSYAGQFLNYGLALIGPGDAGPWLSRLGLVEEFEGRFVLRFDLRSYRQADKVLCSNRILPKIAIGAVGTCCRQVPVPAAV